ncbi:MAG: hypothetical protein J4473_00005 [Candidatus Aenigmarchaeota archaeon]|nr:hypothetical protein [Candidatus Aenigmarchaeota archaeon]
MMLKCDDNNYREHLAELDRIASQLSPADGISLYATVEALHRHGVLREDYYDANAHPTTDAKIQTYPAVKEHGCRQFLKELESLQEIGGREHTSMSQYNDLGSGDD